MAFLVLIPLMSFFLLFLVIFSKLKPASGNDRIRIALVDSMVIGSLFLVVITEFFSFYTMLRFDVLLTVWSIVLLAVFVFAWRSKALHSSIEILKSFKGLTRPQKLTLQAILLLLSVSFFISLVYPANNYDSQTYHMARVGYWEENESISHYQTPILRQIELSPFAEWVILHLQILAGGDLFANAVQLFFFAGCIVVVSMIAKSLGGNSSQQLLASVMACFIPMAVIQSNTTQNDIVVSFFVLAFVYYTLRSASETHLRLILLSGASLGLAWLTKGTAYIFTAVFCGWYILFILKRPDFKVKRMLRIAALYCLIPIIALTINSGHFYRNIFFSGTPLGNEGKGTAITSFEIKPLIFVAVKNIMNNIPVTKELKEIVYFKAVDMGLDPDDTMYNLSPIKEMGVGISFHEDYAQNFLHVIIIFFSLIVFFVSRRVYNSPPDAYLVFVLSVLATAILFSVLLKWQPWSNRLMTPLFLLFSIFIGMEIGRMKKNVFYIVGLPVILYGFIALCYSSRHPVFPLEKSIFSKKLNYNSFFYDEGIVELKKYLDNKPYKTIGIYIGRDSWDYIYYKLLRGKGNNKRLLKHVFVYDNKSKMYIDNFVPDAIISLERRVEKYEISNRIYYRTAIFGDHVLFAPR